MAIMGTALVVAAVVTAQAARAAPTRLVVSLAVSARAAAVAAVAAHVAAILSNFGKRALRARAVIHPAPQPLSVLSHLLEMQVNLSFHEEERLCRRRSP
jgi:hypothetical protein